MADNATKVPQWLVVSTVGALAFFVVAFGFNRVSALDERLRALEIRTERIETKLDRLLSERRP